MPEIAAGLLFGLFVATYYGLDAGGSTTVAIVVAVLAYLASCWGWPWRKCWRCGGAKMRSDGRGNLRERNCRVCKGKGIVRRAGAMVIGRGQ
jgi:4-amino-4-deoxy-L-arabinose transferase-like glycosyltransferase